MSHTPEDDITPGFKPLFLDPEKAAASEYIGCDPNEIPDLSKYDAEEMVPLPNSPLKGRHREVARLHALGKTNNQICEKLGYTPAWISTLLSSPAIRLEVDRYRNRLFESDLTTALKDLGPDAVRTIEQMLRDPQQKLKDKVESARWLLEKLTGKATQPVDVGGGTLVAFMETLRQMQDSGQTIDVTPSGEAGAGVEQPKAVEGTASRYGSWIDDNI